MTQTSRTMTQYGRQTVCLAVTDHHLVKVPPQSFEDAERAWDDPSLVISVTSFTGKQRSVLYDLLSVFQMKNSQCMFPAGL